ncbi:hypothetical protein LPU83_3561 [Rhizobium favelukesii]|uniref:Uncharacterized protein n=1 Tax=Rhizobium favelukesii TaxID=348824 RepID=W6RFU3_9HYPH|nr:hypothetical protein LPU83_3561 [Rhizobium favelukesii]
MRDGEGDLVFKTSASLSSGTEAVVIADFARRRVAVERQVHEIFRRRRLIGVILEAEAPVVARIAENDAASGSDIGKPR